MYYIFLNRSTQKIFLTYEEPRFSPVNILGLDKICRYAESLNEPKAIAQAGVDGVYGEGWEYDPGHEIFVDPLNVVRATIGQCGDYANLLTYLYRSIGLAANSVIIHNGVTISGVNYLLFWHLTGRPPLERGVLLSEFLESCDGQSEEWWFPYHAASLCANYICDSALGEFRLPSDYIGYWKYYLQPRNLTPPYLHEEPPTFEPSYYNWSIFIPPYPNTVLPGYIPFDSGFDHPGP